MEWPNHSSEGLKWIPYVKKTRGLFILYLRFVTWTISIAWQNRNHQFPYIGYYQEMLKHKTDTVLFWAIVTFFPDVCDVSVNRLLW